ncbi:MAG: ROK family protein [Clostridia bacterium]|nr:ROK family protein [Clostridia bacterium]
MDRVNLTTIKQESVRAVFGAISHAERITRAEIAAQTGLSLMTVGKVVDVFLNRGIVKQVKEEKTASGRKAGLVSLNRDYYFLLIDLTRQPYSFHIVDTTLQVTHEDTFPTRSGNSKSDHLIRLLKSIRLYLLRNSDPDFCASAGVLLPAALEGKEEPFIASAVTGSQGKLLPDFFEEHLRIRPSLFLCDISSSAESCLIDSPQKAEGCSLYINADDSLRGAIVTENGVLHGKDHVAGAIESLPIPEGGTLQSLYAEHGLDDLFLAELARALSLEILLLDPVSVILDGGSGNVFRGKENKILSKLAATLHRSVDSLPSVLFSGTGISTSLRGLALALRQNWVESDLTYPKKQ